MREFCPDSNLIAAAAEGSLTADEQWRLENHCAVCDDCRRELAIARIRAAETPEPMPEPAKFRLRGAVSNALAERSATSSRRTRAYRSARTSPIVALAAILVLSLATVLVALFTQRRPGRADENIVETPKPRTKLQPVTMEDATEEEPRETVRKHVEWPPQLQDQPEFRDDKKPEIVEKPEDKKPKPPKPEDLPRGSETVTRVFAKLQLTDLSGELAILRGREKMKTRTSATVSETDVLVADKTCSFHVEGRHALVVPADSRVSVASSATEQATWIAIHQGHVFVDPGGTGGSRWVVSDGRETYVIEKTRARFAASRRDSGLVLTALTDSMRVTLDGGSTETLRAGDEWDGGKVTRSGLTAVYLDQLSASQPRERTIFLATCDAEDASRGRWTQTSGTVEKERFGKIENAFFRSADRQKRHVVNVRLDQRVGWDLDYVVRLRYSTNARKIRVEFPLPANKGTLATEIEVSRDSIGRWVTVEIPLERFTLTGAAEQRVWLSSNERMETIDLSIVQRETYGGARGYLLVDDLQILER